MLLNALAGRSYHGPSGRWLWRFTQCRTPSSMCCRGYALAATRRLGGPKLTLSLSIPPAISQENLRRLLEILGNRGGAFAQLRAGEV